MPSGATSLLHAHSPLPAGRPRCAVRLFPAKSISRGVKDATSTQTNRCLLTRQRKVEEETEGTDGVRLQYSAAGVVIVWKCCVDANTHTLSLHVNLKQLHAAMLCMNNKQILLISPLR